jgi:hypothetical protein
MQLRLNQKVVAQFWKIKRYFPKMCEDKVISGFSEKLRKGQIYLAFLSPNRKLYYITMIARQLLHIRAVFKKPNDWEFY